MPTSARARAHAQSRSRARARMRAPVQPASTRARASVPAQARTRCLVLPGAVELTSLPGWCAWRWRVRRTRAQHTLSGARAVPVLSGGSTSESSQG